MQKHFSYEGAKISYNVTGKGGPIILIHGFAEDSAVWAEQVQFLQKSYLVVTPDLPGSGASDLLDAQDANIEDYARVINALLIHEEIDKCTMIGHSMGGYITLAFAAAFPGRLSGFGFVHSTAFADSEEKKQTRVKSIRFIEENGVNIFLKNTTPNLFSIKSKDQIPEIIAQLIETGSLSKKDALIQYYRSMINRPDRTEVLKDSKVPVLFIIGTEDTAAPLVDLLPQVQLPGIAEIHILQETGHMGMLENPSEVNNKLFQFFELCKIFA